MCDIDRLQAFKTKGQCAQFFSSTSKKGIGANYQAAYLQLCQTCKDGINFFICARMKYLQF